MSENILFLTFVGVIAAIFIFIVGEVLDFWHLI
jgi:hypothetical protein